MKFKLKYQYILFILVLVFILYTVKEKLAATSPATTMLLKNKYISMRNNFVPMGRPLWVD